MASQKKGGWGSLLSGAVANLESRLDTILADDGEASQRERAAVEAARQARANRPRTDSTTAGNLGVPSRSASTKGTRDGSRTRVNDRLAERLAKATAQKAPSRTATPVNDLESPRASVEVKKPAEGVQDAPEIIQTRHSEDGSEAIVIDSNKEKLDEPLQPEPDDSMSSARLSLESSHPSAELTAEDHPVRPFSEVVNGRADKPNAALLAELEQMRADHIQAETQRQDEMHVYMERIDALQAKLTYLAKETVAAAKEANASSGATGTKKQLAEKDERIALLMEEGQKLSINEMKHLQTIKKLRTSKAVDDKMNNEQRKKLERTEHAEADLKIRLHRAEASERQANEKVRQVATIEKQVDELRIDRENAAELVRSLTAQLKEAKEKAVQAERQAEIKATEAEKEKITTLQNDLEDAQIEKRLADDRSAADLRREREEAERQKERFGVQELEYKNEIFALEARLETMRTRAEEASASGGAVEGESSVKLLRQVETLQQQYVLAKGNWETIEGSLNARIATLERERDDANRRENDIRKKARDVGIRSRKAEDQLESSQDQIETLQKDLNHQHEQMSVLRSRLEQSESTQADIKAELERQRKIWESETVQRIEDEKLRWRREMAVSPSRPDFPARKSSGVEGINSFTRRPMARMVSSDAFADLQRPNSRRSSNMYRHAPPELSPSLSRRESEMSFEVHNAPPLTPAIEIDMHPSEDFETSSSPQRTINDLVSTSTAGPGAGPSVQLVERMSALVRKLESEKASFKDELGRLTAQRDDARNEIVTLMREVETKRDQERKVVDLEKEMAGMKDRYDASLEMLGEREEEVDELKLDVVELKRIYRELVETKVGGSD